MVKRKFSGSKTLKIEIKKMKGFIFPIFLLFCYSTITFFPVAAFESGPTPSPTQEAETAPSRKESNNPRKDQSENDPDEDEPISIVDRLAAPSLPAEPTQADYGALVYYQVCMACHGDKGQGLTDEWRAIWEEDSNCWKSKCHGPNHPPWGFEFPKISSPVIGSGSLGRFYTAQDLHQYTIDTMPWWNPGYLKAEEYWQVTAFLLRAHEALPKQVKLDAGNAAIFRIRPVAPLPKDTRGEVIFVACSLVAAAGLLALQERRKR
jgi:mono/diheme cytochrome c family protein